MIEMGMLAKMTIMSITLMSITMTPIAHLGLEV